MPAGLQVFNAYGTIQIDETWRNYGYKQVIPVAFTVTTDTTYDMVLSGEAVLVAARSTSLAAVPLGSVNSSGTWTFSFMIVPPFIGGSYSETIYFYVFDVMPTGGFSNFGMEVFNASGERVFHSDMKIMKIPSGAVLPCNSGYTGTLGQIYAPLVLLNPIRSEFVSGSGYALSTRRLRVSGSSIVSDDHFAGYGAFGEFANEGLYAAVDVTGLS